jgi:rhomboid family GlyGly-CTERM serine protease
MSLATTPVRAAAGRRVAETPVRGLVSLSAAERFALAGAALLLALHALLRSGVAGLDGGVLELRADRALSEPWRLLSAHLVHINWPHALVNAAAWWVVARLYAPELPPARQAWVLLISALVISLGLTTLHPGIAWYRGFSGVLHALFFVGGMQWLLASLRGPRSLRTLWLPVVLMAGGAIKVIAEQPVGSSTPYAEWLGAGTVPQAHLLGALAGAAIGIGWAWRDPGKPSIAR